MALSQDTVKCSVTLQTGSSPCMAFFIQRQYSQKKGTLTKFSFFEIPLMIYDEKTNVSGVISKFLVVDCVKHLSPGHCQAACPQRLELLPTLWLTRLTSGPAG